MARRKRRPICSLIQPFYEDTDLFLYFDKSLIEAAGTNRIMTSHLVVFLSSMLAVLLLDVFGPLVSPPGNSCLVGLNWVGKLSSRRVLLK